ncbi:MAG: LysE family translocator [Alicyclobacillus sp.]|nr:LysE family translocator [Alicyclobacillus sp.]
MTSLFVSGFLLSFTLCLDLGVVNVAVIKAGLERGFEAAFMMGLGSCVGDLIYAGLSLWGMSFLMQYVWVRRILWIGGTILLLYLSVRMFREALSSKNMSFTSTDAPTQTGERVKSWWIGVGLALSSPSAILWFAAVGGSVIATTVNHHHPVLLLTFMSGFFTAGVVWSVFIAWVSAQARRWLGVRFLRLLSLLSTALFLYFACRVFLGGFHAY